MIPKWRTAAADDFSMWGFFFCSDAAVTTILPGRLWPRNSGSAAKCDGIASVRLARPFITFLFFFLFSPLS